MSDLDLPDPLPVPSAAPVPDEDVTLPVASAGQHGGTLAVPGAPIVPQTPRDGAYPLLWYTSNSPISRGQRDCAFRRFGEYHAGPHGTGYRRRATAVPLATGKAVHSGLEMIGGWILDYQAAHPHQRLLAGLDEVIAWAASEAAAAYEATARTRGLLLTSNEGQGGTLAAASAQLILEQRTLIEALVWIYAIVRLPYMLGHYRLLAVEHEEDPVLDCSCGLGDWVGTSPDHATRGCLGVVAQGRADFLWEGWDPAVAGTIVYEEIKTKSSPRKSWEDAWEHSAQLWLNMEAASRRLGHAVNEAFIPVLYKGWRGRDRNAPETEPKYQHTPLCYGYFDAGAPPIREAAWASQHKWVDDYGKGHTLPRTFVKTPIWDESYPLVPVREGASRVESWVKGYFQPAQYIDLLTVLGPYPRPQHRLEDAVQALLAEERMWRAKVEYLRENHAFELSHPLVVEQIPRSWNCTGYDATKCEFKPVCDKTPGWEAMGAMGIYQIRTPHHATERAAWEAAGIVFPGEDEDSEDEGDGE